MLSACHEGSGRAHAFPSNKNVAQVCFVSTHGSLLETQLMKVFTGGWSHRQCLPNKYQNSTLLGGKQAFGINHAVCTNSLGTMNYPISQLHVDWEQSTSQVLRCQPRAILASSPFQGQQSQDSFANSFLYNILPIKTSKSEMKIITRENRV